MTDLPARLRAARSFADLTQPELAEKIELGEVTYASSERGQRPVPRRELLAIAEVCKVPMWFLEHGWKGWMKAVSPEELRQIADELPPPPGE